MSEWKKKMEQQYNKKCKEEENINKKIKKLEEQNVAFCPKCLSQSVTLSDKKKGLVKRSVIGYALLGGVGAITGALTNKNQERVCLKCGHRW